MAARLGPPHPSGGRSSDSHYRPAQEYAPDPRCECRSLPTSVKSEQLAAVEEALTKGAEANGYANELWMLLRVAEVIARVTGVSYHPGHVWHVLRDQLDWTWQRPARRAVERNDAAVEQWVKKRWPQLKKGHGARTH